MFRKVFIIIKFTDQFVLAFLQLLLGAHKLLDFNQSLLMSGDFLFVPQAQLGLVRGVKQSVLQVCAEFKVRPLEITRRQCRATSPVEKWMLEKIRKSREVLIQRLRRQYHFEKILQTRI